MEEVECLKASGLKGMLECAVRHSNSVLRILVPAVITIKDDSGTVLVKEQIGGMMDKSESPGQEKSEWTVPFMVETSYGTMPFRLSVSCFVHGTESMKRYIERQFAAEVQQQLVPSDAAGKLKAVCYDVLLTTNDQSFSVMAAAMVNNMKELLPVSEVTLYSFNKWTGDYCPENSTNHLIMENPQVHTFSLAKWQSLKQTGNPVFSEMFELSTEFFPAMDDIRLFLPLASFQEINSVQFILMYELDGDPVSRKLFELLYKTGEMAGDILTKADRYVKNLKEQKRAEQLSRVAAKFHSSVELNEVLEQIVHSLELMYPDFTYRLLLTHDNNSFKNDYVSGLEFGEEPWQQAAARAYLTGEVQFEDSLKERRSMLYAPLMGRQGTYGVLKVTAPSAMVFPKEEVAFILLLANTAGSALENAQLYQQSRQLIMDLKLINETSHRLNTFTRLSDTTSFMAEQITRFFKAEEAGFMLFDPDGGIGFLPGSTSYFHTEEAGAIASKIENKIRKEKDSLFFGNLPAQLPYQTRYGSLMAVPMVHQQTLKGAVVALHREPYAFSFNEFKLLQSLVHHSTLAFSNAMLREELEHMVITDYLTGLYSRSYLDEYIHKSMQTDQKGIFLLIDIDNFKIINDNYGHEKGDEVIIQVAEVIRKNIRDGDAGARWGGEELAVYLPNINSETGIRIAERLTEKVEQETDPRVTVSCGVTIWKSEMEDSAKRLFNRADKALYEAKTRGKNRVVYKGREV